MQDASCDFLCDPQIHSDNIPTKLSSQQIPTDPLNLAARYVQGTCFLDTLPTMWMLDGWMPRLQLGYNFGYLVHVPKNYLNIVR